MKQVIRTLPTMKRESVYVMTAWCWWMDLVHMIETIQRIRIEVKVAILFYVVFATILLITN